MDTLVQSSAAFVGVTTEPGVTAAQVAATGSSTSVTNSPITPLYTSAGTAISSDAGLTALYNGAGDYVGSYGFDPSTGFYSAWDDQGTETSLDALVKSRGLDAGTEAVALDGKPSFVYNSTGQLVGLNIAGFVNGSTDSATQGQTVSNLERVFDKSGTDIASFGIQDDAYTIWSADGVRTDATQVLESKGISDTDIQAAVGGTDSAVRLRVQEALTNYVLAQSGYTPDVLAIDTSDSTITPSPVAINLTNVLYDASGEPIADLGDVARVYGSSGAYIGAHGIDPTSGFEAAWDAHGNEFSLQDIVSAAGVPENADVVNFQGKSAVKFDTNGNFLGLKAAGFTNAVDSPETEAYGLVGCTQVFDLTGNQLGTFAFSKTTGAFEFVDSTTGAMTNATSVLTGAGIGTDQIAAAAGVFGGSVDDYATQNSVGAVRAALTQHILSAVVSVNTLYSMSHSADAFTATAIQSLSLDAVAGLDQDIVANFSSASLAAFTTAQFGALSADQISALGASQVANLGQTQIGAISTAAINGLSTEAVRALSATQIGYLTADQLNNLDLSHVATLSGTQLRGISSSTIGQIDTSQIALLAPGQVGSLSATQLGQLSATQLSGLTGDQLAGLLTPSELAAGGDVGGSITALSGQQLSLLNSAQLGSLRGSQIAALTPAQIQSLTHDQINGLSADAVENLAASDMQYFSASQMAAFTRGAISLLSPAQLAGFSSDQLADFSASQVSAIASYQLTSLQSDQQTSLYNAQFTGVMSDSAVASLSASAVSTLTDRQVRQLSTSQIASLTVSQTAGLSGHQLSLLSNEQLQAMTDPQVQALQYSQYSALTAAQQANYVGKQFIDWGVTTTDGYQFALVFRQVGPQAPEEASHGTILVRYQGHVIESISAFPVTRWELMQHEAGGSISADTGQLPAVPGADLMYEMTDEEFANKTPDATWNGGMDHQITGSVEIDTWYATKVDNTGASFKSYLESAAANYNRSHVELYFAGGGGANIKIPPSVAGVLSMEPGWHTTYNSNGFIAGLLRSSGDDHDADAAQKMLLPDWASIIEMFYGTAAPGFGHPLPASDFSSSTSGNQLVEDAAKLVLSQLGLTDQQVQDIDDLTAILAAIKQIEQGGLPNIIEGASQLGAILIGSDTPTGSLLKDVTPFGSALDAGLAGIKMGWEEGGIMGGYEAGAAAYAALKTLVPILANHGFPWMDLATKTTFPYLPVSIAVGLLVAILSHHDNPANMPDKYDTQRYGQEVADMIGHSAANGHSFTENANLTAALGGRTGIQAVEETLAQYGTKANAPDWLQPMWDKLVDMFGINAAGTGTLNFGHAINNESVSGATGVDGKVYQYTDLATALYGFADAYELQQQVIISVPVTTSLTTPNALPPATPPVQSPIQLPGSGSGSGLPTFGGLTWSAVSIPGGGVGYNADTGDGRYYYFGADYKLYIDTYAGPVNASDASHDYVGDVRSFDFSNPPEDALPIVPVPKFPPGSGPPL